MLTALLLEGPGTHLEPLLNESGELPDPATLLSEDLLGVGGTDDDLRASHSEKGESGTRANSRSAQTLLPPSFRRSFAPSKD